MGSVGVRGNAREQPKANGLEPFVFGRRLAFWNGQSVVFDPDIAPRHCALILIVAPQLSGEASTRAGFGNRVTHLTRALFLTVP